MKRFPAVVTLFVFMTGGRGLARSVRIGAEALVSESPRSHYSRYVNRRPADGKTVRLNPPRISWPYWPDWPNASRGNHLAHFRKFAYLTGDGRFLMNWQQYGGREFSTFRPWIEYVLPAHYHEPKPEPETETVALFPIAGWVMAHTGPPSLRSTYENGLGIIFQCRPRGGYSHSFNSDASFQLHAYGQMLNHGGGSSANLDAYAYHTMSHNTILVNGLGQAQPSSGQLYPTYGRIVAFLRGKDYVYFAGDATRCYPHSPGNFSRWSLPLDDIYKTKALPYLKRFIRHVLFVRNRYFVIYDDLRSSQPAQYTWLYHILPQKPFNFERVQTPFTTLHSKEAHTFNPPTSGQNQDWVLVLDDAAAGFPPPGTKPR